MRDLPEGHILSDFAESLGLGDGRLSGADRDGIARMCGGEGGLIGDLQRIVPPPKGRDYLVLGAAEYDMVANGEMPMPSSPLMVDGNLTILGSTLRNLPRVVVRGSVEISNCPLLESLDVVCTGWLAVSDCEKILAVRGEVFGPTSIKNCPISRIGADFRSARTLFFQMCRGMGSVNCEVGEGLEMRGCGVVSTGPALQAAKHILIDGCEGFLSGGGSVGGAPIGDGGAMSGERVYIDRNGVVGKRRMTVPGTTATRRGRAGVTGRSL